MKKLFKNEKLNYIFVGTFLGLAVGLFLVGGILFLYKATKGDIIAKVRSKVEERIPTGIPDRPFFFSFESDDGLNLLKGNDGVKAEPSTNYATHGKRSLRVEYPGGHEFPGLEMEVFGKDCFSWAEGGYLAFDVFNDSQSPVSLMIKIKSGKNYPKKSFERSYTLNPKEPQTIRIGVADMRDQLDVRLISYINFYLVSPHETAELYFDNMRLGKKDTQTETVAPKKEESSPADKNQPVAKPVEAKPLTLNVYPKDDVRPINRMIYGSNLDSKVEFEMDVAKFAKDLGITNLRFPGGGSPGYHWKTGQYDFEDRYKTAPLAKLENIIKYADTIGGQLIIQVNIESGTAEEAAGWVDYMNRKSKHRVDYWELGNEVYGDWDKAYTTGEKYAEIVKSYAKAMKAVDPTIKIGADFGGPNYDSFDTALIKNAADDIDFVSYHWYPNHIKEDKKYKGRSHPLPEEIMANGLAVKSAVARLNRIVDTEAPQRRGKIDINFLEWDGSWDAVSSDLAFEYKGVMWSLANGIMYADTFGQFAVNGINVASLFTLQEVMFGLIRGWDKEAGWGGSRWDGETVRPKAYAVKMFSQYFGDMLIKSELKGSPSYYKEQDWWSGSYSGDVPYVSAYASRFTQDHKLAIVLINKHATQDFNVTINLDGIVPQPEGSVWIMNGPELLSQNDGVPHTVTLKKFIMKDVKPSFIYVVPAHSVNLIQVELTNAQLKPGE